MEGSCEHSNQPSGSVSVGNSLVAERLVASQGLVPEFIGSLVCMQLLSEKYTKQL
jgi:hypothetical protein